MRERYLKLTPEELIMDREFIAWVLHGHNQQEWDTFQHENPGFRPSVAKARQIIELLRDRPDSLPGSYIQEIRQKLINFEQHTLLQLRRRKIRLVWRYAASLLLVISVGSAGFWVYQQRSQPSYVFKSTVEQGANNQSRLLLSDGTNVPLEKDNSKIALTGDKQILIDNEQVIDVSESDKEDETKMNEVVIPYGSRSQLMLADGTKVWLNAGSRLAFPTQFNGKKREVYLEGEAYFEVAKNTETPFYVNAGEIAVKVLGTKFNISAYLTEQSIATVLIEGKVSMNKRPSLGFMADETVISPHHRGTYFKAQDAFQVQYEPDTELVIAWTEGSFKFSQVSLTDVFKNLERYYNVKFIVDKKFSSEEIITGKLDLKESIEHVMNALSDISTIQFRIKDKEIFIEEKMDIINMRK